MLDHFNRLRGREINHLARSGNAAAAEGAVTIWAGGIGTQLDAGRILPFAPAIMLWVAFAPLPRLALRQRPFHLGLTLLLRVLYLCQLIGDLGKLRFQGGIFCLQLVDNVDGFFQSRWHGVSTPQVYPPKCE